MNFKTELKDVWRKEIETLNEIDVDSQESLYKAQLERVTSIEKMLTDLEKAEMDSDEKRYCRDMDEQFKHIEIDAEKRDRNKNSRACYSGICDGIDFYEMGENRHSYNNSW